MKFWEWLGLGTKTIDYVFVVIWIQIQIQKFSSGFGRFAGLKLRPLDGAIHSLPNFTRCNVT